MRKLHTMKSKSDLRLQVSKGSVLICETVDFEKHGNAEYWVEGFKLDGYAYEIQIRRTPQKRSVKRVA